MRSRRYTDEPPRGWTGEERAVLFAVIGIGLALASAGVPLGLMALYGVTAGAAIGVRRAHGRGLVQGAVIGLVLGLLAPLLSGPLESLVRYLKGLLGIE